MTLPVVRVNIDMDVLRAEHARLMALAERDPRVMAGVQMLQARGVQPHELIRLPVRQKGALECRAQLTDPYWTLLEAGLTGGEW